MIMAGIVRDVLQITGINNTGNVNTRQTTQFMNANSIADVSDVVSLETSQVQEMVKQYQKAHPAGIVGITVQNRLKGLIWHARDKRRRGQVIDTVNLNTDILDAAREEYEIYLKDVDAGSTVTSLEKFNPKTEFSSWELG